MARVYWGCEMESPSYIEIEQQFKHKPDDKQKLITNGKTTNRIKTKMG